MPLRPLLTSPVSTTTSFLAKVWELIAATFQEWWNDDAFRLASSLAFYTIFSLAPILLISVALAEIVFEEQEARRQVVQQIDTLLGSAGAEVVRQVLDKVPEMGGSLKAIVIGAAAVLIGSTAVFANLQSALNDVWKVEPAPDSKMVKGFIRVRLRSFGLVLTLGFLLLVSMLFNALVSGLQESASHWNADLSLFWQFVSNFTLFAITTLLFAMIYKYLPDVRIRWRDVLMGAAITSGLFSVGRHLIGLYLGRMAIGSAYGAAGSFVILLIWVYYSALISFFGAEFTQVYARKYGTRIRPEEHAVPVGSAEESPAVTR
jgi:membrane protein